MSGQALAAGALGLVGPLPRAAFPGREIIHLTGRALHHPQVRNLIRQAESSGLPRTSSPLVKALVGLVLELGLREVVVPVPGVPTDYRAALSATPATIHTLGLMPGDPAGCLRGLDLLLRNLPPASLRPGVRVSESRTQELPVWSSGQPVAILGPSGLISDLLPRLAGLGLEPAYLEEQVLEQVFIDTSEPAAALALLADFGPSPRMALLDERGKGIRGVILVMDSFSPSLLDEPWFRRRLQLPLLALDVDEPGAMSSGMGLRLETFARMLSHGQG